MPYADPAKRRAAQKAYRSSAAGRAAEQRKAVARAARAALFKVEPRSLTFRLEPLTAALAAWR